MTPLDAVACAALASMWPWNPSLGDSGLQEDACLVANFDVAGRLDASFPDPGIQSRAVLSRSRVELGVASRHNVLARVAIDGRQSAPDSGYLGLEGESWYVRVQIAEARYVVPQLGLSVAGGLVDDPWVITGNQTWTYRPISPIVAERQGWTDRSDFGGALTWTAPDALVRVTASLLSGEGLQRRERNNGKDVHGLVELRPLGFSDADLADALVLSVYAKDGSRGVSSARNHRMAARIHGHRAGVGYGASVMKTWGVAGDPDLVPVGGEAWGSVDAGLLTAAARVELVNQVPGTAQTTDTFFMAAAGVRPPDGPGRPAHLLVGVEHQRFGELSAPVSGGDGSAASTTLFVQVGMNLIAHTSMGLPE